MPLIAAFVAGGYGRVAVVAPVSVAPTPADLAPLAGAASRFAPIGLLGRATPSYGGDDRARASWIGYALYFAVLCVLIRLFPINDLCRPRLL